MELKFSNAENDYIDKCIKEIIHRQNAYNGKKVVTEENEANIYWTLCGICYRDSIDGLCEYVKKWEPHIVKKEDNIHGYA